MTHKLHPSPFAHQRSGASEIHNPIWTLMDNDMCVNTHTGLKLFLSWAEAYAFIQQFSDKLPDDIQVYCINLNPHCHTVTEALYKHENRGILNAATIKAYIDHIQAITPPHAPFGYYDHTIMDCYELANYRITHCDGVGAADMMDKCYHYYALKHIALYTDTECTQPLDTVDDIEQAVSQNHCPVLGGAGEDAFTCQNLVEMYRKITEHTHNYTWVSFDGFKICGQQKLYIKP